MCGRRHGMGVVERGGARKRTRLLTHGARSVLWTAKGRKKPDRLRTWALQLQERRGHNKATIAVANKLARFVWAVWRRDMEFTERPAAA